MSENSWTYRILKQAGLLSTGGIPPPAVEDFPQEEDVRFMLKRLFSPSNPPLNAARAVDYCLIIQSIVRNIGHKRSSESGGPVIQFPSPQEIFNIVWNLVPDYLKVKIQQWAREGLEGPIAREISEYVRTALATIGVPDFLANAVTSMIIPALVKYIVELFSAQPTDPDNVALFPSHKTHPSTLSLDRTILRRAGVPADKLPALLGTPDDGLPEGATYSCLGQPDDREMMVDIKKLYEGDELNMCKPMSIMQIVAATIRGNPKADPEPVDLAQDVWASLTPEQQRVLEDLAKQSPVPKVLIAEYLYTPVYDKLAQSPYLVTDAIRPTFTAIQTPGVTEWVVAHYGGN